GIRVARSLITENVVDLIELTPDVSIVELAAGGKLVGFSLRELDLRARHGVTVLAVRRGARVVVPPQADEKIRAGDVLVAIGSNQNLERVEALATG
ncbi:MAG TPA: TrkA C-terminal domain-containing protein, partial [Bacillota bacterium]